MKFSQLTYTALSIASISTLSQAWPLLSFRHEKRSPEALPAPVPQSYSVVPVDGGSTANNAQATKTVTTILTQAQVQTIVSTVTAEGSHKPVTMVTTLLVPTTVVQIVTVTEGIETKTLLVEPSITSVPYDDGQWKTIYYQRSTLTDVLIPVSTISASASSSDAITSPAQSSQAMSTISPIRSTSTDWAHYYGVW